MDHQKSYRGLANGSGQAVCSCGWESPAVDESTAFVLGRRAKTVDQYFDEHVVSMSGEAGVETTMLRPYTEKAVAPAQNSQPRKSKKSSR